jgi:hypothetical protein
MTDARLTLFLVGNLAKGLAAFRDKPKPSF